MSDAQQQQQSQYTEEDLEEYNYEADKYLASGHSGKGRTKKEAAQHTNHTDPGGHTRKTVQKLINSHENEKEERKGSKPVTATTEKDSKHSWLTDFDIKQSSKQITSTIAIIYAVLETMQLVEVCWCA